jgi:hypothetical protein
MGTSGIISRMNFLQNRRNGSQTLTLLKTQGDGQPLKRIVTVNFDFFLATKKEEGTGALKDVILLDEGSLLNLQQISEAEFFDLVDVSPGINAYRYRKESRTPPRTVLRRHVVTVKADFGNTTTVEL